MNHQVQHNGNIGATGIEQGQTMGFDEPGRLDMGFRGNEGRVEAFHMSNLDLNSSLLSKKNQLGGLLGRGDNRFLDKDVTAGVQGLGGTGKMLNRRRHNVNDINSFNQILEGAEGMDSRLLHFMGRFRIGIVKTHEIVLADLLDALDMYLS